jgi:cell division protein ZapA (FtsZ GTPase activity inhibitor)
MANVEDRQSISVKIVGRKYSFNVIRDEEENIRKAEKLIHEKLGHYAQYDQVNIQDKLAVAALNIAIRLVTLENSTVSGLDKINSELADYLEGQGSLENIE